MLGYRAVLRHICNAPATSAPEQNPAAEGKIIGRNNRASLLSPVRTRAVIVLATFNRDMS